MIGKKNEYNVICDNENVTDIGLKEWTNGWMNNRMDVSKDNGRESKQISRAVLLAFLLTSLLNLYINQSKTHGTYQYVPIGIFPTLNIKSRQ